MSIIQLSSPQNLSLRQHKEVGQGQLNDKALSSQTNCSSAGSIIMARLELGITVKRGCLSASCLVIPVSQPVL
ncbi:hypothetical protein TNCV_4505951 [Trichonephila clavipes]|nr:hypothetical protein TNCV_4505951 [Trichonephila clavipes]